LQEQNKNCDVHVATNRASYHSKKLQENNDSSGKNSFKLLCGNINKNCDHVSINCTSYHSKKLQENNYSSGKNSFKLLRGNINKNCDVHVAINCASYHSKKTAGKQLIFRFSLFFLLGQSDVWVFMELLYCRIRC